MSTPPWVSRLGEHGRSRLAVSLPRVAADACARAGPAGQETGSEVWVVARRAPQLRAFPSTPSRSRNSAEDPALARLSQDVAVPKGQEPQVRLAALLSLLSADSRALPSARPAKPEFSDFPPRRAAAVHQRRCLFGFCKEGRMNKGEKRGAQGWERGAETDKRKEKLKFGEPS